MKYITGDEATDYVSKFEVELKALLEKYKAEITIEDYWTGYSECGRDPHIVFELKDCGKGLEFGSWIDKDTKGKIE